MGSDDDDDDDNDDENNNSNTFSLEIHIEQREEIYLATSDESGLATDAASLRCVTSMNGSLSSDITRDSAYCVNQIDSTPNSLGNTPVPFRRFLSEAPLSTRSYSAHDLINVQPDQTIAVTPMELMVETRESNKRPRSETATSQVSRRPRLTADQQETRV